MFEISRPYLIVPYLIEQSTWGGNYLLGLKNWQNNTIFKNKKIGQSYELSGDIYLTNLTNSNDPCFAPIFIQHSPPSSADIFPLSQLIAQNPAGVLGKLVWEKYRSMPLLIKLNQAYGNSFQLHLKSSEHHNFWRAKPESWYFLEDGLVTCGVRDNINPLDFRIACEAIEVRMNELSAKVKSNQLSLAEARQQAQIFIKKENPWQYVNVYHVRKNELVDLSTGGIHHSWEEDKERYPLGNIVFEVQLDVPDSLSTIRCFDQGKIKDDGSIRPVHISDYFRFLDISRENNSFQRLFVRPNGEKLLKTVHYCIEMLTITNPTTKIISESFAHLYLRDGSIQIETDGSSIFVSRGHSCFIPQQTKKIFIKPVSANATILKTSIEL